jgi:CBS-domain-containing membrane protein
MLHPEFAHGTADDTIYHACELIVKKKLRYLPIVNPEQQLMLSVLSQLDILGEGREGGREGGRG